MVPKCQLDRLWQGVLNHPEDPVLDETRLRILPDTQRLRRAGLKPDVLSAVIDALARRCALDLRYRNAVTGQRLRRDALFQGSGADGVAVLGQRWREDFVSCSSSPRTSRN